MGNDKHVNAFDDLPSGPEDAMRRAQARIKQLEAENEELVRGMTEMAERFNKAMAPYLPENDLGFDRVINLSPEDFAEFMRILEEPPPPNDKLRDLLNGYTFISQPR